MKHTVIRSSQLGQCWSALRFTKQCHQCKRVDTCKLPESEQGRLSNAKTKVEEAREKLKVAVKELGQLRK